MPLKLMYITNRADVAKIAEAAGVDRIFVDMEYIGKSERQGCMDSVKNFHTIEDVIAIRRAISRAKLLVRVNPIHDATNEYCSSKEEIDSVVAAGADIIMLPYFKTLYEVKEFVRLVNKRTRVMLLLETPEAVEILDDILKLTGIDEVHIGINDMSIGYGKKFMFELLADGTVERLCARIRAYGIPYGFGGVSSIGTGKVPAELILKEHYRLGSSMVILSRSFCNVNKDTDLNYIREKFDIGVRSIRAFEREIAMRGGYFADTKYEIAERVTQILDEMKDGDKIQGDRL